MNTVDSWALGIIALSLFVYFLLLNHARKHAPITDDDILFEREKETRAIQKKMRPEQKPGKRKKAASQKPRPEPEKDGENPEPEGDGTPESWKTEKFE